MRTRQWIKGYGWLFPELESLQKTLSRELTESQGSSKQVAAFGRLLYRDIKTMNNIISFLSLHVINSLFL